VIIILIDIDLNLDLDLDLLDAGIVRHRQLIARHRRRRPWGSRRTRLFCGAAGLAAAWP